MFSLDGSWPVPDLAAASSKDPGPMFVSLARPVAGFQLAKGDLKDVLEAVSSLLLLSMPPGMTPSDVCSGGIDGSDSWLLEASPAGCVASVGLKRCLKL